MKILSVKKYFTSSLVALGVCVMLTLYIFARRGYVDLYIVNKVFASASVFLLGIVLLSSTLSRLYSIFDRWVVYRKELGIVGFALAGAHTVISLFGLPQRFTLQGYLTRGLIPFIFGLGSTLLLTLLFVFSFKVFEKMLPPKIWWSLQNWGMRVAGIFFLLHFVIMKYPGWISWYIAGGSDELTRPYLPPASIFAGCFGVFVLLVRIWEPAGQKITKIITPIFFGIMMLFLAGSFWWGKTKTPEPLAIRWETCVRLSGSHILEIYPPVCVAPDGRSVTKSVSKEPQDQE